jgi:aminoglycoside adenylyltransferase-like protein/nucleotidyltransferase-like protein
MKSKSKAPTPYQELNAVLRVLVADVRDILQENFVGAYLQGSFAVGDFDIHSDVDFIIVVAEDPSPNQVQSLQSMHEHIFSLASGWAQHLEGSYFPHTVLRGVAERGKKLWYLDHGARSLIRSDHCNTLIVRWVFREKGVTLAGPPPATLVDPIPVEMLRNEILEVINGWGKEIIIDPDRYRNRFYQGFIVLSYCRMLHDLNTGFPGSKLAGAEWAKANLDPSWSALIDRAWGGRPNPASSVRQPADPRDFDDTLEFVKYVIVESSRYEWK